MNPLFIAMLIIGAFLLWVFLSGFFRLIGDLTEKVINKTKKALDNDDIGKVEAFTKGFKDSFRKERDL